MFTKLECKLGLLKGFMMSILAGLLVGILVLANVASVVTDLRRRRLHDS